MRIYRPLLGLLVGFFMSSAEAPAQESPPVPTDIQPVQVQNLDFLGRERFDETRPSVIINVGNNLVGLQQDDMYLSNTFSIGVVTDEVPEFLKKLLWTQPDGTTRYTITAAHYIYTPQNITTPERQLMDRPYAGWLFVRAASANRRDNILIISGMDVGAIGPASGAEQLQKFVHRLTGSTIPLGWDNQLNNELGINVFHMRAINFRKEGSVVTNDLTAHAGATIGNVNTHVQTGFLYRLGYNLPDDMAVGFLSPGDISAPGSIGAMDRNIDGRQRFGAYVFAGAETRLVGRDIFIDGNSRKSPSPQTLVEREAWGLVGRAGFAIRYKGVETGYVATYTRKQYKSQPADYTGFSGFFVRINRTF